MRKLFPVTDWVLGNFFNCLNGNNFSNTCKITETSRSLPTETTYFSKINSRLQNYFQLLHHSYPYSKNLHLSSLLCQTVYGITYTNDHIPSINQVLEKQRFRVQINFVKLYLQICHDLHQVEPSEAKRYFSIDYLLAIFDFRILPSSLIVCIKLANNEDRSLCTYHSVSYKPMSCATHLTSHVNGPLVRQNDSSFTTNIFFY